MVGVGVLVGVGVGVGVLVGVGVNVTLRTFSWADRVVWAVAWKSGRANEKFGVQSQISKTPIRITAIVDHDKIAGLLDVRASLAMEMGSFTRLGF